LNPADEALVRIVSRFKDFYDGVRALDREDTPLYVRDTQRIDLATLSIAQHRALFAQLGPLWGERVVPPDPRMVPNAERVVVGFCGQVFSGYLVCGEICWSLSDVEAAVLRHLPQRTQHEHVIAELRSTRVWSYGRLNVAAWTRHVEQRPARIAPAPFLALRAPIIVVTDSVVVVNPSLREYHFAKHLDPYAAWQELSMYLGNTLLLDAQPPPRPIDDTLRAHTHGFDKSSFRNTKQRIKGDRIDW
jgi:hypothetical protein